MGMLVVANVRRARGAGGLAGVFGFWGVRCAHGVQGREEEHVESAGHEREKSAIEKGMEREERLIWFKNIIWVYF